MGAKSAFTHSFCSMGIPSGPCERSRGMFIATEHLERLKWHRGADGMLYWVCYLCEIRLDPMQYHYRNMCTPKFRVSIGGLPLEVA